MFYCIEKNMLIDDIGITFLLTEEAMGVAQHHDAVS